MRPRFDLGFPSRFAFAATCCRYRRTTSCPDAPVIRLAEASRAAAIFSLTIRLASRRAALPPRISFISRSAMTLFASTANIIKGLNKQPPSRPKLNLLSQRAAECQPLSLFRECLPLSRMPFQVLNPLSSIFGHFQRHLRHPAAALESAGHHFT
jgi:hypothetical protein